MDDAIRMVAFFEDEDPEWQKLYVTFGIRSHYPLKHTLKQRAKIIWHALRGKEYQFDEIIMDQDSTEQVVEYLQAQLDRRRQHE
jgi:hypothetical protein